MFKQLPLSLQFDYVGSMTSFLPAVSLSRYVYY